MHSEQEGKDLHQFIRMGLWMRMGGLFVVE